MSEWFDVDTGADGSYAYDTASFWAGEHEVYLARVGKQMATLLWNEHPGEWLVRVLEANAPAVLFWRTAVSSYQEEQRVIDGRSWIFFRFDHAGLIIPRTR
jgi:hypothetical protein